MIHHVLQGRRRIGEAERQYLEFVQAVASSKRCFPFLSLPYSDEVEPIFEIHLGEPLCPLDSILELLHEREWVPVGDRDAVQASVVHA